MCMSVCLFACPTAKVRNYPAKLHQIIPARYPSYDQDSVLLWRRCDMLSISGLWVIYLHTMARNKRRPKAYIQLPTDPPVAL